MPNQLPNSFAPLINSIEQVLLAGSGQTGKTIPSQFYSATYWFEDRTFDGLSQDTLIKPSIRVKINSFDLNDGPMQPISVRKANVEVLVQIAWHLDAGVLKQKRTEIETAIPGAVYKINNALSTPENLRFDSLGNNTGLSSGMLTLQKYTNVRYNYSLQVATADIIFNGIMFLQNSNS